MNITKPLDFFMNQIKLNRLTNINFKKHLLKQFVVWIVLVVLMLTFTSAKKQACCKRPLPLTSIHIIDRNGFAETLSNKDRLNQFQQTDFLTPQPYQKVLRIYARDSKGNVRSVVTTYHPNGNPKQYLQILNGRANGNYYEWHENGFISLSTKVIGGTADVTPSAERSWIFDGPSYAWDEDENLLGEIFYCQGSLEGNSTYYHSSGQIWKQIPYKKNQIDGTVQIYQTNGNLLQEINYIQGQKDGQSFRYWDCKSLASQEDYCKGKLENGQYFDQNGNIIAEIKQGTGFRAVFGKDSIKEIQEYQEGILEGEVKVFNANGALKRVYHVKNQIKHGEEIDYYDTYCSQPLQAKLSFYWYEGKIQGYVRTWYSNGVQESQKEMANNAKHGVSTAWYRDGNLMMIEEYDNDKLVRGDYFRKGEKTPVTQVISSKGTVTIFDAEGHFVQKINYENGKPDS
jgi:antitoxin component YwqK of YwqJK toxin-antitoxin module